MTSVHDTTDNLHAELGLGNKLTIEYSNRVKTGIHIFLNSFTWSKMSRFSVILARIPVEFVWTGLFHVGSKYKKNFRDEGGARSQKQGFSCGTSLILSPFRRVNCLASDNLQVMTKIKILLFTKHLPHCSPCGEQLLLQLVMCMLRIYRIMSMGELNEKTLVKTPSEGPGLRQVRKKCRLACCVSVLARGRMSPWACCGGHTTWRQDAGAIGARSYEDDRAHLRWDRHPKLKCRKTRFWEQSLSYHCQFFFSPRKLSKLSRWLVNNNNRCSWQK